MAEAVFVRLDETRTVAREGRAPPVCSDCRAWLCAFRTERVPRRGEMRRKEGSAQEMMDLQFWKQHDEEMMRKVRQDRVAKALRDSCKLLGSDRVSSLA